jgi:hypothetical protein
MYALYRSLIKSRALSWLLPDVTLCGSVNSKDLTPISTSVPGDPYPHVTEHTHQAHPSHGTRAAARFLRTSFPNTTFLHRYRETSPPSHSISHAPRANRGARRPYCSPRGDTICARVASVRLLAAMHGIARRSPSRTRLADPVCPSLPVYGWGER